MSKYLHMLVAWIARLHDHIMTFNDRFEYSFTDKELHFIVIGALGLGLILLIYPLFKLLANKGRVLAITWIYVLTVLAVLTFAIEIGQHVTGTGTMEFGDVVAGLGGFFAVTAAIVVLRLLLLAVRSAAGLARGGERRSRRARA
ncbi:MAG: hypothetical protein Q4C10_10920 [Clostridia bacterium]|nr:hypothetical protein [Clostridia bacterium]